MISIRLKSFFERIDRCIEPMISWLAKRPLPVNILIFIACNFSTAILAQLIFGRIKSVPSSDSNIFLQFFLAGIIFPYLETLIFHYYLIKLLNKYVINYQTPSILISAALFASQHGYSFTYIFATFLTGILFASFYYVYQLNQKNIILSIFTIHMVNNVAAIALEALDKYLES